VTVVVAAIYSSAFGHPQDGPDVDLRVQIKDDAIMVGAAFNLSFLDEYGLAPRESAGELHPVEQAAVREAVLDFIREQVSVVVDGVAVSPVEREWEVPVPDRGLLPLFPLCGLAAIARVHIVVAYPLKGAPEEVSIRWDAYPTDRVLSTPDEPRTIVIAGQMWAKGISWVSEFRETDRTFHWLASDAAAGGQMIEVPAYMGRTKMPVMIPGVSVGLLLGMVALGGVLAARRKLVVALSLAPVFIVGAAVTTDVALIEGPLVRTGVPTVTEEQATAIFKPLHTNIYRSFDYTEEEDVYDALAQSVTGDLLDSLYAELAAGLEMQLEDGAAISRVQSVEYLSTEFVPRDEPDAAETSFDIVAAWRVTGAVFHWGHSHTRTNEYKARYTVTGTSDGWRIGASQVLEQSRIEGVPGDPGGVFTPGTEL
jgi:hypothetical protein